MMGRTVSRRLIPLALMTGGLGWIAHLLWTSIDDVTELEPTDWPLFAGASLALIVSLGLPSVLFCVFVNASAGRRIRYAQLHELYFSGQLLRYLPGRVWGLAYQVSRSAELVPAARLVKANLALMLFVMSMNIVLSTLILGMSLEWPLPLLLGSFATSLSAVGIFFLCDLSKLLGKAGRLVPRRLAYVLENTAGRTLTVGELSSVTALFVAGKIVYLFAWNLLAGAYPSLSDVDMTSLAMMYSIASIVGIASIVTPAGLGVREVSFVVLGSVVAEPAELAFIAVLARLWLMSAEVALSLLSALMLVPRNSRHDQTTSI